jgi:parvulin-like peptidyl-prolyl isomerase
MSSRTAWALLVGMNVVVAGCGGRAEQPLSADVLYRPATVDRAERVDRGGLIVPGGAAPTPMPEPAANDTASAGGRRIAPAVEQVVVDPTPATRPSAALPATLPTGQYMTIGGVIATVSGTPIFADALLRQLEPILSARAPELSETAFRQLARAEIDKQLQLLINAELEFAAANRNLDQKDKQRAEQATTMFRDRMITRAGGSLEVAKANARADGQEFDEMIRQQYRLFLVRIYYDKKVFPRVQITAEDMRRYYERNREKDFTERAQARWRMIKLAGGRAGLAAAEAKLPAVKARLEAGEPFATVASQVNDDPVLLRGGGDVGMIDRGAYRLEAVEQAAWALEPGQVSPPVTIGDDVFLVMLEEKKTGQTLPFDDPRVQQAIRETLQREQFTQLRNRAQDELRREASGAIAVNQEMLRSAMDLAMQNYPRWSQP